MDNTRENNKQKAALLLKKMTLTEKVGQLSQRTIGDTSHLGKDATLNTEVFKDIAEGRVGFALQPAYDMSNDMLQAQEAAVNKSRLKIPLMINTDILHGFITIFPIPLALACSFDTVLIQKAAAFSAYEASQCGIYCTHAPMLDLARDPRWGRVSESFGEDPFLGSEIASAYVMGYQNNEADNSISATAKHFAGYGAAEGGRDYDSSHVGEIEMKNYYLIPFKRAVEDGVNMIMCGFNTLDGIPLTCNKKYLTEILKKEFGFEGPVISDWCAIYELAAHGVAENPKDAAFKAFTAGTDIEMASTCYNDNLEIIVKEGKISENQIDEAVLRVLELKYKTGLMDNPFNHFKKEKLNSLTEEGEEIAEKAAEESAVLLKNDGILPLRGKCLLLGEKIESKDVLGCWQLSSEADKAYSIKKGFENEKLDFDYASEIQTARELARNNNYKSVIVNIGESSGESGEAASKQNLNLNKDDLDLIISAQKLELPLIILVSAGRPLILTNIIEQCDALLYIWFLGHRTGTAVARILSGKINPSGKLPMTFPQNEGQIPIYYNRLPTGRPLSGENDPDKFKCRYIDGSEKPLFPFGYGLSYSKFKYNQIFLSNEIMNGEKITVFATVANESYWDGIETVQLYIRDCFAEISRPVKELKGFKRIFLKSGQSEIVDFDITDKMLAYYHSDGTFKADNGTFEIFIGSDSSVTESVKFKRIK